MGSNTFPNSYAGNFTSGSELYDYFCVDGRPDGEKVTPVCQFPYTNAGWLHDNQTGFNDVVLGDCSITYADSMGGFYETKCLIFGLINFVFLCVCFQYLYVLRSRRIMTKRKKRNLMEVLTIINIFITTLHLICCVDYNAYRGTYNYTITSVLKGAIAALFIIVGGSLITSWVSVIDGGKAKTTPKWCINLMRFTYFLSFFSECGLGIVEVQVAENGYKGGFDSTVNFIKNGSFAILMAVWVAVAVSYGKKISTMLQAGGGGQAEKTIQKYLRAICFCFGLGGVYKLLFMFLRIGTGTIFEFPPCSNSIVDIIAFLFLIIQFAILMVQNPNTGKAKKAQTKVSTTTSSTASSSDERA